MTRRSKILIIGAAVLIVVVLISVIHHYQLRAATEAYIAQLKVRGEPMELAQVIPPPVPAEQNSADTIRTAAEFIDADTHLDYTNYAYGMQMVAPGKAIVCWHQSDVRNNDGTNSWESVREAVGQNAQSFALLRQIIAKPDFDFQIKYDQGVADLNLTNLYLAESKRAVQRLETAALCDLHQGNTASAVTNLQAILAVVKAMRNERLLISELVRIAISGIALPANWEVLQSTNLTNEQLAELQNDWASLDFIHSGENALAMERVTGGITLVKWRNSESKLLHYLEAPYEFGLSDLKESASDRMKIRIKVLLWRYWWSYPDELQLMRGYQISMETLRSAETNYSLLPLLREYENKMNKLGIDTTSADSLFFPDVKRINMHYFFSGTVFSWSPLFDRVIKSETTKQVAIAAIALKRYQLKHGNYPPDLKSLVPEFVPRVPRDPVDGQPLRYRLNPDGTFLLYSVGENGKDDGGNPALEPGAESSNYFWLNSEALDWVWPQPATEAEIQNYYAHPTK
jgi:hypothetical protein